MGRKETKNSIRQTSNCTCIFCTHDPVFCRTDWLDFIQAMKLVSSGGIRVMKVYVIAFLLLCDGFHGVCLGLAYLAKLMGSLCMDDLRLFSRPNAQCI